LFRRKKDPQSGAGSLTRHLDFRRQQCLQRAKAGEQIGNFVSASLHSQSPLETLDGGSSGLSATASQGLRTIPHWGGEMLNRALQLIDELKSAAINA